MLHEAALGWRGNSSTEFATVQDRHASMSRAWDARKSGWANADTATLTVSFNEAAPGMARKSARSSQVEPRPTRFNEPRLGWRGNGDFCVRSHVSG